MAGVILFETIGEAESDGADFDQRVRHRRSRRKGWRAGLASHTVIENLEDPQCYRSFERTIVGSFGPRTIIELELIHRLASLLWRLRRASAIETGLFGMQDGQQTGRLPALLTPIKANRAHANRSASSVMAQHFMDLCRFDPALLDRAGAYEMRLWRQTAQTIWLLDAIRRPPPTVARRPYRKLAPHYLWDRGA
ncbi:MAG TPA: hypothetical protein VKL40_11120 [Candidatus Angelobacter sp.]|nr:hypothetical protein [Terriglobia bacterium]HMF91189.1 hypothetical protein [Candidatus Angelobacter sp.]